MSTAARIPTPRLPGTNIVGQRWAEAIVMYDAANASGHTFDAVLLDASAHCRKRAVLLRRATPADRFARYLAGLGVAFRQ